MVESGNEEVVEPALELVCGVGSGVEPALLVDLVLLAPPATVEETVLLASGARFCMRISLGHSSYGTWTRGGDGDCCSGYADRY